ncbi:S-adenosyl-L-methionine-dependent methyltransferase [Talaromyces proteolyticus]|uniref:S-adenosyl-L-methionine-dependent methyltransferase n=1 Tax=Talaromyces proteolyticus TaxID=1131652 RepID=A0AAD4KJE7_9EURO|nr:S-adenosyl-L-methionine-dependent methyltransferase [Talaromyces proteolyticus]KAH8692364.1 S-adenosyl-L-methionine-dependent methyltransferase [Talaromyces proteolyticus]
MTSGYLTPRRSFLDNEGSTSRDAIGDGLSINVLTSPAQAFKYENSRRYHSYREGSYWGPNDEQDGLHQTITHRLFCLLLQDKLYLAPLSNPQHILDIGTGIGLWATNMADALPNSQILGIDLSPTWHDAVRPNLQLEVDDCCSNWTYADEGRDPFDFIHIRCLYGSIHDWHSLYRQAFDHLNPGGYIEQAELSLIPHFRAPGTHSDSVFERWYEFWKECSEKTGKSWLVADRMGQEIYDVGFEDVCEARYMLPLFNHDDVSMGLCSCQEPEMDGDRISGLVSRLREIRKWFQQFWQAGMEGWILAISTRYMGWTADQAREFVRMTNEAIENGECDVYYEM